MLKHLRTACNEDERSFTTELYIKGLHWRRTSIRDGHAAKAVFQRQSFSFTLEPPIHGLFWRYLRHFCSVLEHKLLNVAIFFLHRIGWMTWISGTHFIRFAVHPFEIIDTWWVGTAKTHTFELYTLVCSEAFSYTVRRIPGIPLFCFGSALVRNYRNFSAQQISLPTHLYVCYRDRADPLYITGVIVHYSAFHVPGYALGPKLLAISPPLWVGFYKKKR